MLYISCDVLRAEKLRKEAFSLTINASREEIQPESLNWDECGSQNVRISLKVIWILHLIVQLFDIASYAPARD